MTETCLVIGAGQAGLSFAQTLRDHGYVGRITLIGEELHPPYQRPPLSKAFLAGGMAENRLHLKPAAFYTERGIELTLGQRVERIDRVRGRVEVSDGTLAYDRLVIATGTRSRPLNLPGADLDGVHSLRALSDVGRMRPLLARGGRLVIVGGGYIGLEVAAVARAQGLPVTVLETRERVLARVVAEPISRFYEALHRANGVDIVTNVTLAGIERIATGLAVVTHAGTAYAGDIVLIAIGALANSELAAEAGLSVRNGVRVDEFARTFDPAILAMGDCAAFPSVRYGREIRLESVQNAIEQARHAAATVLGRPEAYDPVPWFWSDQFDIKLQIAGLSDGHDLVVQRGDSATKAFSVFYLKDGCLIAVDSVNRPRDHMLARRLVGAQLERDPAALSDLEQPWDAAFPS